MALTAQEKRHGGFGPKTKTLFKNKNRFDLKANWKIQLLQVNIEAKYTRIMERNLVDFAGTSVQKKSSFGHWLFRPIKLPRYEFTVEMVRVDNN